jgi:hypothetical protein
MDALQYRAFIENKVEEIDFFIRDAIKDVVSERPDGKAYWMDDEGIHHVNFKNGIGFTVDIRLHHSPNV